jgi:hypothetical protein
MKHLKSTLLGFCLLALNSCITPKEPSDQQLHSFESQKTLVIPPICDNSKFAQIIGRSLTNSLTRKIATDVRYAGDIPQLTPILSKSNLMSNGQTDIAEISRIASAIKANEVVTIRITSMTVYPPQSMSALVIMTTFTGDKYKNRISNVNLNMKDHEHKKELAEFVRGTVTGPLGDRFIKKTNVNLEAALLSNDQFLKYAGHKIAKSVLFMKKY